MGGKIIKSSLLSDPLKIYQNFISLLFAFPIKENYFIFISFICLLLFKKKANKNLIQKSIIFHFLFYFFFKKEKMIPSFRINNLMQINFSVILICQIYYLAHIFIQNISSTLIFLLSIFRHIIFIKL